MLNRGEIPSGLQQRRLYGADYTPAPHFPSRWTVGGARGNTSRFCCQAVGIFFNRASSTARSCRVRTCVEALVL